MTEPKQKPGKSRQDYETPQEFINAVERRFGRLSVDLAASNTNTKASVFYTEKQDSLIQDWDELARQMRGANVIPKVNMWLNMPFGDIASWAAKCAESTFCFYAHTGAGVGGRIIMLTPASIGSNWFMRHVHGKALVLGLHPRLTFEGTTAPYPKDLMLSVYGEKPGFDVWRWK